MEQEGLAEMGIVQPLSVSVKVARHYVSRKGSSTSTCRGNLADLTC